MCALIPTRVITIKGIIEGRIKTEKYLEKRMVEKPTNGTSEQPKLKIISNKFSYSYIRTATPCHARNIKGWDAGCMCPLLILVLEAERIPSIKLLF